MSESYIEAGDGGTAFVGPDATKLYAAIVVSRAIKTYVKTGLKMNRAYTPTNMRAFASNISGKTYPRSRAGLTQAADDLDVWIAAMRAALPVVEP